MSEQTTTVTPAPTAAKSAAVRSETKYLVLWRTIGNPAWSEFGPVFEKSPEAAIMKAIGDDDPSTSEWVAIADRYWSPTQFEVKVARSLVPKAGA